MKNTMAEKMMYMGAGIGVVIFAVFGLLHGSFLGGVIGLKISAVLFGEPVTSGILARAIVAVSMLLGVLVPGMALTAAGSGAGWLIGSLIDLLKPAKTLKTVAS